MESLNNIKNKIDQLLVKYKYLVIILILIIIIRVYILIYIKEDSNTISFSKYIGENTKLNTIDYNEVNYLIHKKYINSPNFYKHIILFNKKEKNVMYNSKLKIGDLIIEGDNNFKFFSNINLIFNNTLIRNIGFISGFKISGGGDTSILKDYLICYPIIVSNKKYSKNKSFETILDSEFFKKHEPNFYVFRHINMTDSHRDNLVRYNKLLKNRLIDESFFKIFVNSLKKHYCNISQKARNLHSINFLKSCNKWYLNNTNTKEYKEIIDLVIKNNDLKNLIDNNPKKDELKKRYNKNILSIREMKNKINFTSNQYIYILFKLVGIDLFFEERNKYFLNVSEFSYFVNTDLIEKKLVDKDFIFLTKMKVKNKPFNYLFYLTVVLIISLILLYRNSKSFKDTIDNLISKLTGN